MRQANDDMKRAGSQNASAADSRRAADRLREATDLLGGLEQQDAAGSTRRRERVRCRLAKRGKKWLVTGLEPLALFAPPKPAR